MLRVISLALCVLACNAASLPMGQQTGTANKADASSQDWAVCNVNGQQLKPGQRATSGSFVFECQLSDNVVRTTIVACLDDGEDGKSKGEHPHGDRWVVGKRPYRFVYECAKSGDSTVRKVAQCFYDSDEGQAKLDPGAQQQVGKNVIRCLKRGENGVQFDITYGQNNATTSANTGTNTNTNTNSNSNSNTNTNSNSNSKTNTNTNSNSNSNSNTQSDSSSGQSSDNSWAICHVNGQQLKPGQRTTTESFVYECQLEGKMVISQIVGCVDANSPKGEHPHGDRWVEGERPYHYVFECTKTGEVTQKKAVQCFYDSSEGQAKLDIGSEQRVGKYLVRCGRLGDGVQYFVNYVQSPSDISFASAPVVNSGDNTGVSASNNTNTNMSHGQMHQ